MDKHLFLIGGGPPFPAHSAKRFTELLSDPKAPVAILIVGKEGWEQYIPRYTQALIDCGVEEFRLLPLPSTSVEQAVECINNCSGIMIGGGNTNLYADYIVETAISDSIKQKYEAGIPVAGFSAGALISPATCVISPKDNEQHEFQHRKGIGLINDVVIAVHFSEWEEEGHLRQAASRFSDHTNYGIDENTCAYFVNGQLKDTDGNGVFSIENDRLSKIN
ncbi:Type 1 glutamine amidotransferase-like domain-containing protein [Paenibacillus marinisediminis]